MPFPMAGEPLHAAAEAPVARSAGHDHAVELVLAHLVAQRLVAALVFLLGEMIIDRVAVVRRVVHVRERRVLVEARAHLVPALVSGETRRLDVHGGVLDLAQVSVGKQAHAPDHIQGGLVPERALILAIADADGTAGGIDRLLGEREIGDLLDRRLLVLVDVAVLDAVVDRPCRALGIEVRR